MVVLYHFTDRKEPAMSNIPAQVYALKATEAEYAADRVVVTDLFRTALGHFARITDNGQVAYVARHHDGNYDHLDGGAWPVHPDADTASRREIAVAAKIAQVAQS